MKSAFLDYFFNLKEYTFPMENAEYIREKQVAEKIMQYKCTSMM